MEESKDTQLLRAIDIKLGALVAIQSHRLLSDDPNLAKPRSRSIDKMLFDVGMRQSEIGQLLGKTRQAVGQSLKKQEGNAT